MSKKKFDNSPKIILGFKTKAQANKYFKESSYTRLDGCNGCETDLSNDYIKNQDSLIEQQEKIEELEDKLARCQEKFYELYGDTGFFDHEENDFYRFVEEEFPEKFNRLSL